jgi:SHS2 domain-containing protein
MSEYVSKEELKEFFESIEITVAGRSRAEAISEVLQAIYNGVMELSTTDAEPVRHGKWTDDNACSECGCQPWYERDIHSLHYCPMCGARMDKE